MLEELRPHIAELRSRLFKSVGTLFVMFFLCFNFWEPILGWIIIPLQNALGPNSQIIAYKMGEQFFVAVKVAFFSALMISLPVIFYQIWSFVAPGLYENEKKHVVPFVVAASIMFAMGASFAYFVVFPYGFTYLVNFGASTTTAMISIGEYLGFFLKLMFGFGISFELPVFTFFLAILELVNDRDLKDFFKYAILIIFVFAAILTPPDILTQFLMAAPLILLYGLSIIIVKMVNPAETKESDEESKEDSEQE